MEPSRVGPKKYPDPAPAKRPGLDPGSTPLVPTDVSHTPRPKHASQRRSAGVSLPPYLRERPRANKATFLYRFYDAKDELLYVGITDNLIERTFSHARASTWMEFAVRSTIERHAKRRDAEEAEVAAIRGERPLFNLAYNDDTDGDRRVVDYLIEHDRRDLLRADVSRG